MTDGAPLAGKNILLIEDDFYQAKDEKALLEKAGARVLGPFGSGYRREDLALDDVDAAVIDINLGQGPEFELARILSDAGVPFVFVTGYDVGAIPETLAGVPRVEKPFREQGLIAAVTRLLE